MATYTSDAARAVTRDVALPDPSETAVPRTTTGEIALPMTSEVMLGRLAQATPTLPAPVRPASGTHRRETFRPLRRETALLWTATGALAFASTAFVAGVLLVG